MIYTIGKQSIYYAIYGVIAKWRIDTINNGENFDDLLIEGKLVKL